jgi:ubiquinone/menaquinone biosynthesis C-methylase UbiE
MSTPPAFSFAEVADAYDRARPGYPDEATAWLAGSKPAQVLELGAGTGKLTAGLVAQGHEVTATDPLAPMLRHLAQRVPRARVVQAVAERIPLPSRSVDTVVSAQAFHWFDLDRALPEIARVLRPGGSIALVWNERDERIPWVRRLGEIIGTQDQETEPTNRLLGSQLFGYVDKATFRFWQPLGRDLLRDLVRSRSNVATMTETDRARVLHKVDALYDDYGRGPDGMLLPYVTRCFKATVRPRATADDDERPRSTGPASPPTDGDDDELLIDFS